MWRLLRLEARWASLEAVGRFWGCEDSMALWLVSPTTCCLALGRVFYLYYTDSDTIILTKVSSLLSSAATTHHPHDQDLLQLLVSKRGIAHRDLWFKVHQVSWDISRFKAFSATCSTSPW